MGYYTIRRVIVFHYETVGKWIVDNKATQQQAAEYFGLHQSVIQRYLKNYCKRFNVSMPDNRRK